MTSRRGRVDELALLPPTPLLGGAGLLVDEHRHAGRLAQRALHGVEVIAAVEGRVAREAATDVVVAADVVGTDGDRRRPFGLDLPGDGVDGEHAVDRLAARHRHRVVEEDLVGDVGLGRDRLADRQVARVVVGAVAQVLEHVRDAREARVRDPVDAFAPHLDQARRVAVHPGGHEVAADAGLGPRTLGHARAGAVRAAGAEIGHALDGVTGVREQLGGREVDDKVATVERRKPIREPLRDELDQPRRPELAQRRDEPPAGGIGLADDARPHGAVVEVLAKLRLDDRRLLLDHQDLLEPLGERVDPRRLERIGETHLVDGHARVGERLERDLEPAKDLEQVEVGLADRHDPDHRPRRRGDRAVDAVDTGEGAHGVELGVQPRLDRQRGQVGPAVVQAARGRQEARGRGERVAVEPGRHLGVDGVEVDRRRALHHLGEGGETDPVAAPARQGQAIEPEGEELGDARRREHRHVPALHRTSLWCGIDEETQPWSSPATTSTPPCGDEP
jgi:hypothetical protein